MRFLTTLLKVNFENKEQEVDCKLQLR